MRGRIATCSERLPRCEVASVSPQSSESALAGRRGCVPRRQETGGRRRQNRQYCGYFMSALTELTSKGGEGMVVKPLDFIARGPKGLVQPAIKCRGREYLRIIYGPEYTADDQLPRLRSRGLSGKRSLAAREFSLGVEALERFVAREPLRRVHECVFGVLALESEPVDPRL